MKGIIFTLFEDFISENWGEDTYEDILDDCPEIDAVFVAPKTYPDAWLVALLMAGCKRLEVEPPVALRAFGTFCMPRLVERYPIFIRNISHPRDFLLTVHDVIHVEVKKLMKDSHPPILNCRDDGSGLLIDYHSRRQLCHFMEGLLDGLVGVFGVPLAHEQQTCTHRGDPHCTFHVRFGEQV